ncbi:hypothetical protein XELAEV_18027161mg [Xenopus laevis]|uniref:Secreted protein n=1 Tax=Xenopus laevis TaxID=8355 RepID=A0A974CVS5_XENLA|nr:hypothetical protein XELAEV_18027161mg [Xenopus laevis]
MQKMAAEFSVLFAFLKLFPSSCIMRHSSVSSKSRQCYIQKLLKLHVGAQEGWQFKECSGDMRVIKMCMLGIPMPIKYCHGIK